MAIRRETLGEALFYEYARIIADARFDPDDRLPDHAGDADYWSFLISRYRRLCRGRLGRSSLQRESRRAAEASDRCAYCGATDDLQWDHLVPLAKGGPDDFNNLVRACARCNASKGARSVTIWATENKVHLPRWVRARHLKPQFLEELGSFFGRRSGKIEDGFYADVADFGDFLHHPCEILSQSFPDRVQLKGNRNSHEHPPYLEIC